MGLKPKPRMPQQLYDNDSTTEPLAVASGQVQLSVHMTQYTLQFDSSLWSCVWHPLATASGSAVECDV